MFSKKPEAEFRPPSSMSASSFSVLAPDVEFTGNLKASADLHIDGRIEGDVSCASLVQGEGSEITGTITAETARLAGKVKGSISVKTLIILKSARIEGDVTYDDFTIEHGAHVNGKLTRREEPKLTLAGGTEVGAGL